MDKQLLQRAHDELNTARITAMHNTMAARVPECGDFGAIAQTLDYVIAELRAAIDAPDPDRDPPDTEAKDTALRAALAALNGACTLTTYASVPSSIFKTFYASATGGEYVDLRQLRSKVEPAIAQIEALGIAAQGNKHEQALDEVVRLSQEMGLYDEPEAKDGEAKV